MEPICYTRELKLRAMKRTADITTQKNGSPCVRVKTIQPYTWEQFRVNENEPGQVKTKLMKRRKNNVLLVLFFN